MYKFKSLFLGLITLFFSTIFFVSCDDATSSAYTGVRMIDNTFSPPVVRVHEGEIKENVNTCCAITMEPDEVLELLEKLESYINE